MTNFEFRNPAPEEGFCGIQMTDRDGQIFIRILIPSQEVKFPDPGRRVRKLLCKYMYRRDSSSVYDPVFLHDP